MSDGGRIEGRQGGVESSGAARWHPRARFRSVSSICPSTPPSLTDRSPTTAAVPPTSSSAGPAFAASAAGTTVARAKEGGRGPNSSL